MTTKYELAYLVDSHENTQFDADWWNIDAERDFMGEFDSREEAIEAADANGVGVYLIGDADEGKYEDAVRVIHGAKPEVRPLEMCE